MASETPFARIRALDVRLVAAIAATLLLVIGVMWVVPTTPNSNSFIFDTARRSISNARPIEFGRPVEGAIVDGSDSDFYQVKPVQKPARLDVHMSCGAANLIPALVIFDTSKNIVQEKTDEYVRRPGADIDFSFPAQSNMTYYVQVFSQRNTTGPYTLTVTVREP
jgi:hypothetical protein